MFGKRITLFRIFGFAVRIDLSWVLIALLVTWSLLAVFGNDYPELSPAAHWAMALGGMLGLFASVVFHELSHSLMARRRGMEMGGITLFIFGGVAEMTEEPPNASAEFWMAIVGPLSSLLLAGLFWGAAQVGSSLGPAVTGVLLYLASINVVLAVFNLVPGFPLDGGRVLRAVLWGLTKNLRRATRIASQVGAGFGILLIAWGALTTLRGNVMGGVWFFLIGMFLRNAAQLSYRQLVVRRALEGEPVHRFMQPQPVTVTPDLGIDRLVDDYVYRYLYKMYPVVDSEGALRGCISTRHIKDIPRQDWPARRVGELMEPCTNDNSVSPLSDAMQALTLMNRTKTSRLLVVDGGRLVGVLVLKDLLRFLSLKMDLEENDRRPPPQGRGDSAAPAAPGAWRD